LLNHPHLQPYILKIHQKLNSPRRNAFPLQWPNSNYGRRTRFVEPESVSTLSDQDRYLSLNNHRALNPSISGTEQSSQYSTQRGQGLSTCSEEKLYNLSARGVRDYCNTNKSKAIKSSTGERTPRLRIAKDSSAARRQTLAPPKIHVTGPKRESVSLSSIWLNIINSLYTFWHLNLYLYHDTFRQGECCLQVWIYKLLNAYVSQDYADEIGSNVKLHSIITLYWLPLEHNWWWYL